MSAQRSSQPPPAPTTRRPRTEPAASRQALEDALLALQVREAQLRGIFETANDAIVTADATQTIVMANPAAAAMFGLPLGQLVGSPLSQLVPERHRVAHQQQVSAFGESGIGARHMGTDGELTALRADGTEFPIDAAISRVHVDGKRLFTVIVRDITERRLAERRQRDSQRQLEASHAVLRRLVSAQDRVQEAERRRIARELHDDLQQTLAAIVIEAAAMRSDPLAEAPPGRAALDRLDALASAAIESTRRIVQDLRPQTLEQLGLEPALEALASRFAQQTGICCSFQATPGWPANGCAASDEAATGLYRVAQEALNNVHKHAQAQRVWVTLSPTDNPRGLVLRIRDDGRGSSAADRVKPEAFGLVGMRERVLSLGGSLRLSSEPGQGTTLEAEIPI